jgi:acetyl-CoA acetyltransferase
MVEALWDKLFVWLEGLRLLWGRVNVCGESAVLGHSSGVGRARALVTLLYALKDRKVNLGRVSLCLGRGQTVSFDCGDRSRQSAN